ncbi:MAG: BlaI/MecI/CopY family transcriptional regulator [Acidobacteria bacterium]|nr:BlaI/MecI/CopY family transcriptional regulator [Acidobacteriota bacterium]
MDVLFQRGSATVAEVREQLAEPPSYSSVRALLRILEDKGFAQHSEDGPRYVYSPTIEKDSAQRSALRHLRDTLFNGSSEQIMAALLDDADTKASHGELDRLAHLIDRARDAEDGGSR